MVDELAELRNADRSLFPSSLTIRALRDSRYHNSAYAIAELIDNSIEAGAEQIELLCMESVQTVAVRDRARIAQVAVLDNGTGMNVKTLFEALKFGGGTRHFANRGIGKYGMGLPTSSMSQCKRVDVWTWQDGVDSAWHSSIDVDMIEEGDHNVPLPDQNTPITEIWLNAGDAQIFKNRSGTLVVWSKLDKLHRGWKTGRTIIEYTSREVGRIHRHFINAGITRIRAASFRENRPHFPDYEISVVANDPIYLMSPNSVNEEPWDREPMFTQWGDTRYYPINIDGREETIEVKYSIVKPEALKTETVTQNPGSEPRGQHAKHNIGVSVVREEREIVLEGAFLREGGSAENPQNRWWGCEVLFHRSCDDLFGVDHNKQMVANFTQAAKTLARDDRARQRVLDEEGIEDDIIYEIVGDIRDATRAMMREIQLMFAQKRKPSPTNGGKKTPEDKTVRTQTGADKEAVKSGSEKKSPTDIDREKIPGDEREAGLAKRFIESGTSEQDAKELAKVLVREELGYQFNPTQLDGYQMFRVRSYQGVLHIELNIDHPIYDLIKHIEGDLDEEVDESNPAFQAIVALRLLLSSWARMEDQTESREERTRIQDISMNWGRQVDKVISYLRERDG